VAGARFFTELKMQISDDIFLGPAVGPVAPNPANPSRMSVGVGPMGRWFALDIVPVAAQAAGLAAAQAVAGAGNLTLVAGTGVVASTLFNGLIGYTLDHARCVSLVSTNAGDTTQTALVTGLDVFNTQMTARVTLNGTTQVQTLKAFKTITSIAMSAATAGNISAGYTDRLGFPYVVADAGYLDPSWAGALARDAGTVVVADSTSPATALTGDVRGLYTPSSACNGVRRLIVGQTMSILQVGPAATRVAAFGVTQA
jgi:hypothetical protein